MSFLIPFLILSMENLLYILCTQTGYPEICPQLLMACFHGYPVLLCFLFPVILRPVAAFIRVVSVDVIHRMACSIRICSPSGKGVAGTVQVCLSVSFVVLRAVIGHAKAPAVLKAVGRPVSAVCIERDCIAVRDKLCVQDKAWANPPAVIIPVKPGLFRIGAAVDPVASGEGIIIAGESITCL